MMSNMDMSEENLQYAREMLKRAGELVEADNKENARCEKVVAEITANVEEKAQQQRIKKIWDRKVTANTLAVPEVTVNDDGVPTRIDVGLVLVPTI